MVFFDVTIKEFCRDEREGVCMGGTTGVEGQRDGKLHEGKFQCVWYGVTVATCKMCVGIV